MPCSLPPADGVVAVPGFRRSRARLEADREGLNRLERAFSPGTQSLVPEGHPLCCWADDRRSSMPRAACVQQLSDGENGAHALLRPSSSTCVHADRPSGSPTALRGQCLPCTRRDPIILDVPDSAPGLSARRT